MISYVYIICVTMLYLKEEGYKMSKVQITKEDVKSIQQKYKDGVSVARLARDIGLNRVTFMQQLGMLLLTDESLSLCNITWIK